MTLNEYIELYDELKDFKQYLEEIPSGKKSEYNAMFYKRVLVEQRELLELQELYV